MDVLKAPRLIQTLNANGSERVAYLSKSSFTSWFFFCERTFVFMSLTIDQDSGTCTKRWDNVTRNLMCGSVSCRLVILWGVEF